MSDIQDEAYSEAMDELERLKGAGKALTAQLKIAVDEKLQLKSIIGELADALDRCEPNERWENGELIQRAREAIK